MTGYKFEMWADSTAGPNLHVIRITDPYGELIGEVRSLAEETSLRLAHELKKADSSRFKTDHGIIG
jgi:hypothetical protein